MFGSWRIERIPGRCSCMPHQAANCRLSRLETYLYWAMIHVMAARMARRRSPAPPAPVPAPALPQAAPTPIQLRAA